MQAKAKALTKKQALVFSAPVLKAGVFSSMALMLVACGGGDARTPFLWQNLLGTNIIEHEKLITDAEGNTYRGYLRAGQVWLRKIDRTGKTVWETAVNDTPIETSFVVNLHLFATNDGPLAVMEVPALNNVTLQRTSFNGTTLSETTLNDFHGNLFNPDMITADLQGNVYIAESSRTGENTETSLFKVNPQGTVEWTKSLTDCPDQCFEDIEIVAQQPVYLRRQAVGHTLVALDNTGRVRWQQPFEGTGYAYYLTPAGDTTVLWGANTLHTYAGDGSLLGAQPLQLRGVPLWNNENTLYVQTETQLLAMDKQTNVLHSLNLPIDSQATRYTPIVSGVRWQPARRQIAFIQEREDYKSATVYGRHDILVYDESLTLQQTYKGATHVVTPCGLPGCYIPHAYGDIWASVAFAGNDRMVVSGVRQGEGYYTGAYSLPPSNSL